MPSASRSTRTALTGGGAVRGGRAALPGRARAAGLRGRFAMSGRRCVAPGYGARPVVSPAPAPVRLVPDARRPRCDGVCGPHPCPHRVPCSSPRPHPCSCSLAVLVPAGPAALSAPVVGAGPVATAVAIGSGAAGSACLNAPGRGIATGGSWTCRTELRSRGATPVALVVAPPTVRRRAGSTLRIPATAGGRACARGGLAGTGGSVPRAGGGLARTALARTALARLLRPASNWRQAPPASDPQTPRPKRHPIPPNRRRMPGRRPATRRPWRRRCPPRPAQRPQASRRRHGTGQRPRAAQPPGSPQGPRRSSRSARTPVLASSRFLSGVPHPGI